MFFSGLLRANQDPARRKHDDRDRSGSRYGVHRDFSYHTGPLSRLLLLAASTR